MEFVKMEVIDHIAIVTFHRAPINAVSHEANIEISETFEGINQRDDIWCVIFRGEGKGFMSGSDTGDAKMRLRKTVLPMRMGDSTCS